MKLSASVVRAVLFSALIGAVPMMASADFRAHGGGRERGHQQSPHQQSPHQQGWHQQGWHGDIRAFPRHDMARWRGGHWYHGHHDGRIGWWWVVGPSLWYYYPTVVYPYPDPYIPPVVADPNMPPPPQYWYFCGSAKTYYPYVQTCPEGWKTVPVTPEDVPAE